MSIPRPWLAALVVLSTPAGTDATSPTLTFPLLLTVGPATDASCDYQSIQDALDFAAAQGPELDFIRVRKDHSPADAHILVDDHSITIEGGFDTCGSSTRSGRTVLDGSGGVARSVVEILGTSSSPRREVTLRSLEIRGGEADAGATGGGIDIGSGSGAALEVTLENVVIEENESILGGGLAVNGALAALLVLNIEDGSLISNNAAMAGGGIHCTGAEIFFRDGLIGPGNQASLGGGVFLDDGFLQVEAGGLLQGIQLNEATSDGGGVFAQAGSGVILLGSASHAADLSSNHAGGNGGGAFLSDAGLLARSGNVSSNSADADGGGIYATDGGSITLEREGTGSSCHDPIRCSRLSGNFAVGLGGALYLEDGATADVFQTYVEGNGGAVRLAYVEGTGSSLLLEGDVIAGHDGGNLFQVGLGGALTVAFSSVTDNPNNTWIVLLGDQSTVELHNSIFWEDQGTVLQVGGQADVGATCLLAHESATLPPGSVVETGNPFFIDPSAGNYHLAFLSHALDRCDTSAYEPLEEDIDGETRGVDLTDIFDAFPGSHWDIGADELNPITTPIFADGFESGDLSSWS